MQFVTHWRLWWKRWSTWLAAAFAAISAAVTAYPSLLLSLINVIPEHWRGFLAGSVFVIVFVTPVLAVHIRQAPLKDKADAQQ